MVKTVNIWKTTFYKNDDNKGGAMDLAIKECPPNNIVIHSQTKKEGRMWGFTEPIKFLKLLEKNCGLYEVITQFPHKMYFDIDKDGLQDSTYLEHIKAIITEYFPNAEMAISGSYTDKKTSFHIVLQNYVIHNEDERKHIKHLVKYMQTKDDGFDWKVYTKNRNMKCINQSKEDGRIQTIFDNNDFKAHIITSFISNYSLPFQPLPELVEEEIQIEKSKKTFDLGLLPKMVLKVDSNIDIHTISNEKLLELLPIDTSFHHDYTHLVARFCYYNNITFETFYSWIRNKHDNPDYLNKWRYHWSRLDKFPEVGKSRILTILNYFYPHLKKDIHYRRFCESFMLPESNIVKIETINQNCFESKNKYEIFNVGMGGGKTAQTIQYLKSEHSFVWIAPNIALSGNTHKRFSDENMDDVCLYNTISAKDKKAGKLFEMNKLIICLNSLLYIANSPINYDVVVIDEVETLLNKFLGDFIKEKKQIWNIFVSLFRKARKVILLDAFITKKTLDFIKEVEYGNINASLYERKFEPSTRTIKYVDNFDKMMVDIVEKIKSGLKVFIFYPYKKNNGVVKSMLEIFNTIEIATGKKGEMYNADIGDKTKAGLKNVNKSWGEKDFIIVNNIVTCGVNYENMDFAYKYIFIASHNSPRDIAQISYRIRNLSSGIIKICYMGKMNQSNTWLNDCIAMECPIYNKLYNNILIEEKSPIKKTIQLFFNKAHYKQKCDDYKVNSIIEKEIKEILDKQDCNIEYFNISDIDSSIAEIIEQKCIAQDATMMEKYSLNKYYFKKSFIDDSTDGKLAFIWDFNYCFLFQRLTEILSNKDHLFNKIAQENNLPQLFPVDVKKIKYSKEVLKAIFAKFSFKFITADSSSKKITTEIFNTFFSKYIISVSYDANKNPTYSVDEGIYDLYEFAKTNLIIDKKTYMTYQNILASEMLDDCIEI